MEELKDYKYYGKTKDELRIHLQDFSENGADYAHFGTVHNLLTIQLAKNFFHFQHTANIEFGEGEEKHMAWKTDIAEIGRNKDKSTIEGAGGKAVVTYYGPGFLVFNFKTRVGNPIIVKTFTPIGELKVRMKDHIYAPKGSIKMAIKYVVGEASVQFHDDINIWERKSFAKNPTLVKGNGPIMKMRKWYSQFYA